MNDDFALKSERGSGIGLGLHIAAVDALSGDSIAVFPRYFRTSYNCCPVEESGIV